MSHINFTFLVLRRKVSVTLLEENHLVGSPHQIPDRYLYHGKEVKNGRTCAYIYSETCRTRIRLLSGT
nr:MAG TPA: hypothetical protein [Caudoviricetes sp.]